jgi:hypothetical protein
VLGSRRSIRWVFFLLGRVLYTLRLCLSLPARATYGGFRRFKGRFESGHLKSTLDWCIEKVSRQASGVTCVLLLTCTHAGGVGFDAGSGRGDHHLGAGRRPTDPHGVCSTGPNPRHLQHSGGAKWAHARPGAAPLRLAVGAHGCGGRLRLTPSNLGVGAALALALRP